MSKKFGFLVLVSLLYSPVVVAQLEQDLGNLAMILQELAKQLGGGGNEEPIKPTNPILPIKPTEPTICIKPTGSYVRNVLKSEGSVTQLKISPIENAQAMSGYMSVYYGLAELATALNKEVKVSFDSFEKAAQRSIKKRRVQVACANYIASILSKPPYLVAENNLPTDKLGFNLTPKLVRSIYRSLIGDLAMVQAGTYVAQKYTPASEVADDKLVASNFIVNGVALRTDFSEIVKTRQTFYTDTFKVSSNALIAVIDQPTTLATYVHITDTMKAISFNEKNVLAELHKNSSFGIEEGAGGDAMPKGAWLNSSDIEHLLQDPCILGYFGLEKEQVFLTEPKNFPKATVLEALTLSIVDTTQIFHSETLMNLKVSTDSLLSKELINAVKKRTHVFIVNAGFNQEAPNAVNNFNWIVIVRKADNTYVIAEAKDVDILADENVTILQGHFKN